METNQEKAKVETLDTNNKCFVCLKQILSQTEAPATFTSLGGISALLNIDFKVNMNEIVWESSAEVDEVREFVAPLCGECYLVFDKIKNCQQILEDVRKDFNSSVVVLNEKIMNANGNLDLVNAYQQGMTGELAHMIQSGINSQVRDQLEACTLQRILKWDPVVEVVTSDPPLVISATSNSSVESRNEESSDAVENASEVGQSSFTMYRNSTRRSSSTSSSSSSPSFSCTSSGKSNLPGATISNVSVLADPAVQRKHKSSEDLDHSIEDQGDRNDDEVQEIIGTSKVSPTKESSLILSSVAAQLSNQTPVAGSSSLITNKHLSLSASQCLKRGFPQEPATPASKKQYQPSKPAEERIPKIKECTVKIHKLTGSDIEVQLDNERNQPCRKCRPGTPANSTPNQEPR